MCWMPILPRRSHLTRSVLAARATLATCMQRAAESRMPRCYVKHCARQLYRLSTWQHGFRLQPLDHPRSPLRMPHLVCHARTPLTNSQGAGRPAADSTSA